MARLSRGRLVALLGVALLAGAGPLSTALASAWAVRSRPAPADVIVVLGGGATWPGELLCASIIRVQHGALLYRRGLAPQMLISGGKKNEGAPIPTEARLMGDLAQGLGVPPEALVLEERSRTTWENGVETASLMRTRGWRRAILVTDAIHMRRAGLVFSHLGIETTAASAPTPWGLASWPHEGLTLLFDLAYEVAATVVYKFRGWV